MQRNFSTLCINGYLIARFDQGQRPSDRSLGRYVSDHETVAASGKSPVGYQRDLAPQPAADDGTGRAQHLAHPGAAFRSFVADDDHVARLDLAAQDALQRFFL